MVCSLGAIDRQMRRRNNDIGDFQRRIQRAAKANVAEFAVRRGFGSQSRAFPTGAVRYRQHGAALPLSGPRPVDGQIDGLYILPKTKGARKLAPV